MSGGGTVILNGKLYYNDYSYRASDTGVEQNVVCVDLHTGKELWVRNWNNTRLEFGQLFYWQSYNYQGVYGYLWAVTGSTWDAYDPLTGRWIYRMMDVPSGTRLYGPRGEIYIYYVDLAKGWMMLWNSSRVVSTEGSFSRALTGQTFNVSMNGYTTRPRNSGYEWNKTIPTGLPGVIKAVFLEDRIIGSTIKALAEMDPYEPTFTVWGVNLKPGQEGTLLFNATWQRPDSMGRNQSIQWKEVSEKDLIGVLWSKELLQHYAVSLETGKLIWGPTTSTGYLDFYEGTVLTSHFVAYGNVYTVGLDGIVHCYDGKTGTELWTYTAEDPYTETEIGNNWWLGIIFFADGKVYLGHGEHSPNMPLPRGAPFICLNATSGEEIFRIDGAFRQTCWGGLAIIGDSIMATQDTYDQRIYAVGKGPSATTVTAPDIGVTTGTSVVIRGAVTDISPGTKDSALTMRFPNGVPTVSDASMSDWMLYVYMQFARPTNATGVPVSIDVIDSNGNYRNIGNTTTDATGSFSFQWTPDISGKYTVIASFAGTNGYWPSYSETSFAVDPAAPTASPYPVVNLPPTETYFAISTVAIIVAIAIVGALLALLLRRKRP